MSPRSCDVFSLNPLALQESVLAQLNGGYEIISLFSFISSICYTILFAIVFMTPKLQVHPMRIFMWLYLVCAFLFWHLFVSNLFFCECENFFNMTTFGVYNFKSEFYQRWFFNTTA